MNIHNFIILIHWVNKSTLNELGKDSFHFYVINNYFKSYGIFKFSSSKIIEGGV